MARQSLPNGFGLDVSALACEPRTMRQDRRLLRDEAPPAPGMFEVPTPPIVDEGTLAPRGRSRPSTLVLSLLVGVIIACVMLLWEFMRT